MICCCALQLSFLGFPEWHDLASAKALADPCSSAFIKVPSFPLVIALCWMLLDGFKMDRR